jgi:translation initiation factor IF-3
MHTASRVSTLTRQQAGSSVFMISITGCTGGEKMFMTGGSLCDSPYFCGYTAVTTLAWEDTAISELFINEQIRDREVRVIGADGEQLGVMQTQEALQLAQDAGVDLVKIVPTAKPPVCRIVEYSKYKYEQIRKEKEARKKQKVVEIKEIRLSPNIEANDLNTKTAAARKFLEKGNKVKVTLRFRGREMAHMSTSRHILDDFAVALTDVSIVEKPPKIEGRSMSMFLGEKR